ncbi:MAG: polysaccharide biosynthesis protein [Gammaproteobacteria bacterium]|jgi:FlaA1/EpsC-like NDP-sugar epimerase|nr:polysaccharide biosynthesis protein [Gammaproteobacteria bacterium]MBT3859516.1 polysaccharide biosynthesis protein [Gammaproteobacteria bacterium]MBT3986590.1 polysaccharide biosynthesis protein [Gammaproteobacteria bacterium]MBT4255534.1 polysaccharide biosynthesis protein [Gammaproteobacteria bacterium]MBT4581066.1 polysaccharide biosynthesis protein [Gammaproteobacteria bacterium]
MHLYTIPLSRTIKQMLLMAADSAMIITALALSFILLGKDFFAQDQVFYFYLSIATMLSILVFIRIGLYRALVLYMGLQSGFLLLQGVTIASCLLAASYFFSQTPESSDYAILPIFWMIALLFIGGSRFVAKVVLQNLIQNFRPKEPVIIYGAGSSGMQLVVALQNGDQYLPVAFVDDGHRMLGSTVHGIRVHGPNSLYELIESFSVRQILLAIPSATHAERKEILNRLEHLPVHVKTVPDLFDMVSGKVGVDEIRDIDIEDLLGRDIVPPNPELLGACISGQSVMVTGAGGSIGSELCRQIININPARLVLLDTFEYGLYEVENELRENLASQGVEFDIEIVALLGSVCNKVQMENALQQFDVDTVYHVAAYKQVPMVEKNIVEGVQNNIFGTLIAAKAADKFKVKNFVLISTDKAVRPTNFMGATKRFAEQVLQAIAQTGSETRFSMVRFGNVLGSSGSVVPLFRRQISAGGPVTVTHPEVTRYFMTVQEAAQLVIQAGSMATGGDVFVLDMNDPIKIIDLAKKMVHLMGYDIKDENSFRGDIGIEYTGLRPGEKLYEELLIGESVTGTEHPKIMRAEEDTLSWDHLDVLINRLDSACRQIDLEEIRQALMEAVDGFEPKEEAADPLWEARKRSDEANGVPDLEKVTPLFKE